VCQAPEVDEVVVVELGGDLVCHGGRNETDRPDRSPRLGNLGNISAEV
jgi:hypothetical protein